MNKKVRLLLFLFIACVLAITIWWALRTQEELSSRPSQNASKRKEETLQYSCPMHPQIKSHKPGSCPICGMDLVSISQDEHSHQMEEGVVEKKNPDDRVSLRLSLRKQQMIGIKIWKVQKKKLFKSISVPGSIAFDPELYTAQSEYLGAIDQWKKVRNSPISNVKENTKQMIESAKIRLKVLGLSDAQIKALAKKGRQSEGLLMSGKDQDAWVYASVFEVDLPHIKKGLSAKITANFLQGETLPGKVVSVDRVIDPKTRTARVRIKLVKSDPSIRPESYVNVTIFVPLGEHIVVPAESVMSTGKENFVFVKKDKGIFEPRKINILLEANNDVAVKSNLDVGEEIVIDGNFMIDSESRLKAVLKGPN